MATTRWIDTQTSILEEAIMLLCDAVEDDSEDLSIYRKNWRLGKAFSSNKTVKINGRDIKYNIIKYS